VSDYFGWRIKSKAPEDIASCHAKPCRPFGSRDQLRREALSFGGGGDALTGRRLESYYHCRMPPVAFEVRKQLGEAGKAC
jgi:hypothetical protein